MSEKIKFILNGCDIELQAEAPKDITLEQLLQQCDRIIPSYCACGICSLKEKCERDGIDMNEFVEYWKTDVVIDYDSVKKGYEDASCYIKVK